jgi:hypothetical protein
LRPICGCTFAPAFDTPPHGTPSREFVGHLEVAQEGRPRLDGDDGAVVLPDAVEERGENAAALGG